MDNNPKPDYDEMFRRSQITPYSNGRSESDQTFDSLYRQQYAKKEKKRETVTPEVLDSDGRPINRKTAVSGNVLGLISAVIGVVSFILIFLGLFFRFFMALNILLCLAGIGFGAAALMKKDNAGRLLAVAGIALCIFDLVVQLICTVVVAVSSGISAIFGLFM